MLHKVLRRTEISAYWYGPYYIWGRPKMLKTQSQQNLLDTESSGQYWAESLSDGETVIDTNHKEDSLGEISEEEDTSEEVKRVSEVIGDASDKDIISIIKRIKKAKENDNSTIG